MKLKFSILVWAVVLSGLALFASGYTASAGSVGLSSGFGGAFSINVVSLKEARFKSVIKQQYDFSCGSAALATLLKFHYDYPVTEEKIFTAMYEAGDKEKIKKLGFSLLDMKKHVENIGLKADGYRLNLDKLQKVGVPAITLINTRGYKHFVVLKGVTDDEVVVGDPAMGVRVMSRDSFEKIWNKIAFVVRNKASLGRKHFNLEDDWGVRVKAPFGTALSRQTLSSFTIHLPNSNPF